MRAAADDGDAATEADFNALADRLIQALHDGRLDVPGGELYMPLVEATYRHLDQAVSLGWHAADPKLRQYLGANVLKFSGFKTHQVLREMAAKLTDDQGQVRPFAAFRADALAIHDTYNVRYLRTEYETAVASAQMASKWSEFPAEAVLRYDTAGDERVRADHAAYDGITRPKDDVFWQQHYPPCDWACRCTVVEVDDDTPVTPASGLAGLPPVPAEFQPNVGQTGTVFDLGHHAYGDVAEGMARKIEAQLVGIDSQMTAARKGNYDREIDSTQNTASRAQHAAVKGAGFDIEEVLNLPAFPRDRFTRITQGFKKQQAWGWLDAKSNFEKVTLTYSTRVPVSEMGLTALHEHGHLLDLMHFEPRYVMAETGIEKAEVNRIVQAAKQTRLWQQYQGRLNLDLSDEQATELTNPKEVWARAFAQYIAEESGNETVLAAVKEHTAAQGRDLPEHWTTEDFAGIRREMNRLFAQKKWLRNP